PRHDATIAGEHLAPMANSAFRRRDEVAATRVQAMTKRALIADRLGMKVEMVRGGPQQYVFQRLPRHGTFFTFQFLPANRRASLPFQRLDLIRQTQQRQAGTTMAMAPGRFFGVIEKIQPDPVFQIPQSRVAAQYNTATILLTAFRHLTKIPFTAIL